MLLHKVPSQKTQEGRPIGAAAAAERLQRPGLVNQILVDSGETMGEKNHEHKKFKISIYYLFCSNNQQ